MKMAVLIPVLFVVLVISLLAWASYPWSLSERQETVTVHNIETDEMMDLPEEPWVVKILTWNIGYLYGKGSEGDQHYQHREKSYFEERLNQLVKEIKEMDPDVLFLQEIDFESGRSGGQNQAEILAKKAGYPFVAQAVSWDAHYIPFPYWPLSRNFGRMRSGGAILSRYPLVDHKVTLLAKPLANPWWYNLFYLHRYFQEVTIEVGKKKLKVVNLHLEAFDKADRQEQVKKLAELVKKDKIDVVAGDFNMLPSSAAKKTKFDNGDDYENDPSFELMQKSGLLEVIPEEIYGANEATYFTFPSWKPDRRLDYVFYQAGLKMMKAEVLPSALSDHLPLRASFQIGSPKINPYSL